MKNILDTTGDILELVKEFDLEELELDTKDLHIRLSTVPPGTRTAPSPIDTSQSALPYEESTSTESSKDGAVASDGPDHDEYATIASPMVGSFYRRPAPDKSPYVEVGDTVDPGQPVCIIEAMKLMNEIKADIRGKIVKIMVENEQPVQEGQVLFLIDPV